VLVAAVDATRLGYRCPLPADLLRAAAEEYCDSRARENPPADWFESALDYATKSLHGAVSALRPVTAGMGIIVGYTVADDLLQYATPKRHRQLIPRHTWDALLTHTHDPADAGRIGRAASNRLLYSYALPLLRRGAAAGNSQDVDRLADLLIGQGDIDAATLLLHGHADGEPVAAERLAGLLAERGDVKALGERADAGDSFAAFRLADLLVEQGNFDAAIALLRKHDAVMTLSFEARWWLVRVMELCFGVLMMHGYDLGPIVSSLREHDVQSRIGAQVAELFDMPGTMHKRADTSRPFGASVKIDELLAKRGDVNALRERIHAGDFFAVDQLAGLLVKRGDTDAAVTLLSEHANAGDPFAAMDLARLLKEQGDTDTLRERANAGDPFAIGALSGLLIKQGDADAAITLLREHADSGHFIISVKLHTLLAEQNDTDVLRERAAGDPIAIVELTERGETEAAIALLRERADAGILFADMQLAHLLAKQSDAEKLLLAEVQVGNSEHAADAWFRLLENSDNPQDQDRARRTRRFGLIPPVP
jgi:tetratricopeptide (TPR) repeat protein